jgi:hypothetical protein
MIKDKWTGPRGRTHYSFENTDKQIVQRRKYGRSIHTQKQPIFPGARTGDFRDGNNNGIDDRDEGTSRARPRKPRIHGDPIGPKPPGKKSYTYGKRRIRTSGPKRGRPNPKPLPGRGPAFKRSTKRSAPTNAGSWGRRIGTPRRT